MEQSSIPKRILVIDDDEGLRTILHVSLEQSGYIVESFSCGNDALEAFEKRIFDAVITDFMMPGMNGVDIARIIKSRHMDIPVIMVTGEMLSLDNALFADNGIDFLLLKPYRIHEIVKILKRKLGR